MNPLDKANPDFRPAGGSASTIEAINTPDNGFFEPVSFIGGVDPNNDWTSGWTTSALN